MRRSWRIELVQSVVILRHLLVDVSAILLTNQGRHIQPTVPVLHRLIYAVRTIVNQLVLALVEEGGFGGSGHCGRHVIDLFLDVRSLPRQLRTIQHVRLVHARKRQKRIR